MDILVRKRKREGARLDRELKDTIYWDLPGGPSVKNLLPLQDVWILSLFGELRSNKSVGPKKNPQEIQSIMNKINKQHG